MFEEVNKELIDAKEKLCRKQKFENLVDQTREVWQKELDRKKKLESILQDEEKDVKKLESLSITGIFHSILGSKQQQLEKERQEALSARLKYEECCKSVLALERELASYKNTLNSLFTAKQDYETALKRKEEFILQLNDDNSEELLKLMNKSAELKTQKKELEEAITSGGTAQAELECVINSLENAEGWGTWDILGGGILATAAKHSSIDEAKEYAYSAKIALIRFQNELSDVNLVMNIGVDIGSFETFADYFFDGLISDWVVQSKISKSLESVQCVARNVNSILVSLKEELNSVQNELLSVEGSIRSSIEQAKL